MHILSAEQFNKRNINRILQETDHIKRTLRMDAPYKLLLRGNRPALMGSVFLEPSTRTRLSFEAAMKRMGGEVVTVAEAGSCSQEKGESIADTVRTISHYVDLIVLRQPIVGIMDSVSKASKVPVINAGDGSGEHPSQALLDLYTIKEKLGHLDEFRILFYGDNKWSRAVRSLATILDMYPGVKIDGIEGDSDISKEEINKKLVQADVIYVTRPQVERWRGQLTKPWCVKIGREELDIIKPSAIILHPLPKTSEIMPEVDNDPRAVYWEQVENGLYLRMALIGFALGVLQ